jgi:L-fuconolactonase
VNRGIAAVGDAGLAYDLLVRPRELPAALDTVRAHPDVPFVIDHLAKPPIKSGELEPWLSLMRPFGALDNVACKVSGLVTEANWGSWRLADLQPFVDAALEIFGPDRLMFGSDWPVCLLAATYEDVLVAARSATAGLSLGERDQVFGETARRVYGLDRVG